MAAPITKSKPLLRIPLSQAAALAEVPLAQQVEDYLSRLRFTVPFPCTFEEAYFGLVPVAIEKWFRSGMFTEEMPKPGRDSNLLNTMFHTHEQQPRVTRDRAFPVNILHVCLESEQEYIEGLKGTRGFETIIWFDAPKHVPLPRNSQQTPFFLAADHPHHDAIKKWAGEAYILESEIQQALKAVQNYAGIVGSTSHIRSTWPELLNFCKCKNRVTHADHTKVTLKEKVGAVVDITTMNMVTDLLTAAAMLPEKQPKLSAWAYFHTSGRSCV